PLPSHCFFLCGKLLIIYQNNRTPGLRIFRALSVVMIFYAFFKIVCPPGVECPVTAADNICIIHKYLPSSCTYFTPSVLCRPVRFRFAPSRCGLSPRTASFRRPHCAVQFDSASLHLPAGFRPMKKG